VLAIFFDIRKLCYGKFCRTIVAYILKGVLMKIVYMIGIFLIMNPLAFAVSANVMQWQVLQKGIEHRVIERHYNDANSARQIRLHAFRIKQGAFKISTHSFHNLVGNERGKVRVFRKKNNHLMVLSGGFFQTSFREPVGLVVEQGKRLFPLAKSLSGVIWIKQGQLHLSTTKDFKQQVIKPDFALQGYPRIVDPLNKRGIQTKRELFRHRVALCSVKDHFIVLISDKQFSGLSLYELSTIAQASESDDGLACDIAINLDGGPAPAISVDEGLFNLEVKERIGWQVPNVLVIDYK
jgi:uncharacterized protein YigE (DUF2233 family)